VLNWAPRYEDVWGSGGTAPPFLTSALDGGEWPASRPGSFTTGERTPGTYSTGGCVNPRASLDTVKYARNRNRAVQPVDRRSTDWAISAPNNDDDDTNVFKNNDKFYSRVM
jgi:hypothetical protein